MKLFKKRNWAFYLTMFLVFSIAFFLVEMLIDGMTIRRAVIGGLVSGTFFTFLDWVISPSEK